MRRPYHHGLDKERESLFEAAADALEAAHRLLCEPLHDTRVVVAVGKNVVTGRQTMLGTFLLHFIKLRLFEFVVVNRSPIVR
jgi:hypothetical protein